MQHAHAKSAQQRHSAGTLIQRSELPFADVLARSYLRHHPEHDFVVTVIDGVPEPAGRVPYQLAEPDALPIDRTDLLRLTTSHPAQELRTALVPYLLSRLLDDYASATYLRAEMYVLGTFDDVDELLAESAVVLVPRSDRLGSTAGHGIFNDGFISVTRGAKAEVDKWCAHVVPAKTHPADHPSPPPPWDRLAASVPHAVLRDPGIGLAYWNVDERPLTATHRGEHRACGVPLRLIDFSGYRPATPWLLTTDPTRNPPRLSAHPVLRDLCEEYRKQLQDAGNARHTEPSFDTLPDGTPITTEMRRLFAAEWHYASRGDADDADVPHHMHGIDEPPPHPFDDDGAAFRAWLQGSAVPVERAAGLNRLVMWLWRSRPDLQVAFPEPYGRHAPEFRRWCRDHGQAENALPSWCLPTEPPEPPEPVQEPGVNVVGFLTAGLGLGQMGRVLHDVVRRTGLPVASVTEHHSLTCPADLPSPDTAGAPRFPISILAVNADFTRLVLNTHPDAGYHRYRIGLWAWELEEFPESRHGGFADVDEVWTVSEFCRAAIAPHSPVPVKVFPAPVTDPGEPDGRAPYDHPRFLSVFDFNSTAARKNPWGVIEAFQLAFPEGEDVRLTFKTTNGDRHPEQAERLRMLAAADRRIELIEGYLPAAELADLYRRSSAYVSLHRSEGFGLTVAEAMAHGVPVIATDYSSTTELLDESVGWPVSYRMTTVGPGAAPYPPHGRWAEPDTYAAARAMREVATDPQRAAEVGSAARERILRTRAVAHAVEWTRAQLDAAYLTWQQRATPAPNQPPPELPVDQAREALRWRPETGSGHRTPLAPALRRMVLRAIDHYDVHLRQVMGRLLDGVHHSVMLLNRRFTDTEATTERLQNSIADLERRLARVERTRPR